jgi:antimicrobial peptide system SdpA family protein
MTLALIVTALVVSSYAVHAPMPANAVSLPYESSMRSWVRQLLPEGWAFFTRSPREADVAPVIRTGHGRWRDALLGPHAEPRNAFGFARRSRAQGVELGMLSGSLRKDAWTDCRGPVDACLERATAVGVANTAPAPTLCGAVGLVSRPPVPWAWSRSSREITMPARVARLEVSC